MSFVDTSGTDFIDTTGTGNIDPAIMDASTLGQDLNANLINQDFSSLTQQAFDPSQVGFDNSLQSLMNTTLSDPSLQGFGGNASGAAPSWNPQLAGQQAGQEGGLSTDGTNRQQPDGTQQNRNVNPQQSFYQQLRDALSGVGRQIGNLGFSTPANAAPSTNTLTNADLGPQTNFANPMPANTLTGAGSGISPTQTSQTTPATPRSTTGPGTPRSTTSTGAGNWGDWDPNNPNQRFGPEERVAGPGGQQVSPPPPTQTSAVPTPQARPASADLPQSGVLTPDTGSAPDSTSTAPRTVRTTPYTSPPPATSTPQPPDNTGTAPGARSTPSLQQLSGMLQRMGLPPWLANVIAQAVGQQAGMQRGMPFRGMPFRGMPFRGMPGRMPFPMMRGRGRGGRGFRGFPGFPGRGMPPWMRGGRFPGGFPGGFPGEGGQPAQNDPNAEEGQPIEDGTPDFSNPPSPQQDTTSTFRPEQAGAAPGGIDYDRNIGPPQNDYLPGGERSSESPLSPVPMGAPGTPDYTFQPGMRLGPQASTAPAYRGQPGVGAPNFMRGQFGGPGRNLTTVTTPGGHSVQVNQASAPAFRGFLSELEAAGAPIQSLGGFANRRIAGSGQISQHAFGNAIDIDQSGRNRVTPAFRQWAQQNAGKLRQISYKYGMVSGGDWRHPDFGHFEWSPRAMPSPVTVAIRERPWNAY